MTFYGDFNVLTFTVGGFPQFQLSMNSHPVRCLRASSLLVALLGLVSSVFAQDQTVNGNLNVTANADVSGNTIITGDVGASHVVSASGQGSSAFYGNQAGNTFGSPQPVYAAVSDNPNGNQNWFFRGTVGGIGGTETFSIRADGQIHSAVLAGTGTALVSVDSNGVLSRSASIASNGGNVGIGTSSPADTLTANGNIRALASNNGGFMAYDSPSGGNHLFSLVRGNGSNDLDISAYGGIGFSTNAPTGPSTNYSMFIAPNGNVGIGTASPQGKGGVNFLVHSRCV